MVGEAARLGLAVRDLVQLLLQQDVAPDQMFDQRMREPALLLVLDYRPIESP